MITPPSVPSQNVIFSFSLLSTWDDSNTQEKLETMVLKIIFWVNKVHYGLHVCENGEYKIINENNVKISVSSPNVHRCCFKVSFSIQFHADD